MSKKDSSINFGNTYTQYLSKNINFDDLLNDETKLKEKEKAKLNTIFNLVDTDGKNSLEISEINNIINKLDNNKDKKISDDDIKTFCKANKLNKKSMKNFLLLLQKHLPQAEKHSFFVAKDCHVKITKYSFSDIENYETVNGEEGNKSAIYDKKNDVIRSKNGKNPIQIIDIEKFINLTKTNEYDYIEAKDTTFENFPKIVIQSKDGQNIEIPIKIQMNLSINQYMYMMTNLVDTLAKFPEEVIEDLTNNVKHISVRKQEGRIGGIAYSDTTKNIDKYSEDIAITFPLGFQHCDSTLAHEIGHTVDNNISGYATGNHQILKNITSESQNMELYYVEGYGYLPPYAQTSPQELFAEYYSYKHTGKAQGASIQFIESLSQDVKNILENIKQESINMTKKAEQKAKEEQELLADLNKQDGAIKKEDFEKYSIEDLWWAYSNNEIMGNIVKILQEDYPHIYALYQDPEYGGKDNSHEYMLDIVKNLRNDKKIKPYVEQMLKDTEKHIAEKEAEEKRREEFNGYTYAQALPEIVIQERKKPIKYKQLNQIITKLKPEEEKALYNNEEIREILIYICDFDNHKYDDVIPPAFRERFQKGSTEPITKEIILRFRNQIDVGNFIARNLYKKKIKT